jgi:hypothetical protein
MYQSEPAPMKYTVLITEIEKGEIKIPQFQREFVWTIEQAANLLDSIFKGYPIGTFIFWITRERLRSIRNLGKLTIPPTEKGYRIKYILDGQQRLTSLYVSIKGEKIEQKGRIIDFGQIFVNLAANESKDEPIIVTDISNLNEDSVVKFTDLLAGGSDLYNKYKKYSNLIDQYRINFSGYSFSVINVADAPIDIATEIFTRINIGGKPLSVFEIMCAKIYDEKRNFDLAEKCEEVCTELSDKHYEIPPIRILQAVSICMVKDCDKTHILKLDKDKFIDIWDNVVDAFKKSVDYFRSTYRIKVSQLLPYDSLLIPFTYFFFNHPDKPLGNMQVLLQDFFWRVALTKRYQSSLESKIAQDIKAIDLILKEETPKYDTPVDITTDFILNNGTFNIGSAFIKALLCVLAYQEPKSFADESDVAIDNSCLKQSNSKNYHHFFPKAFLKKQNIEEWKINNIVNITIVDDYLNKRQIRDKAPSVYIKEFIKINPNIEKTLATHLIGKPEECGILEDDYNKFINSRLAKFNDELKKRLILTEKDRYK